MPAKNLIAKALKSALQGVLPMGLHMKRRSRKMSVEEIDALLKSSTPSEMPSIVAVKRAIMPREAPVQSWLPFDFQDLQELHGRRAFELDQDIGYPDIHLDPRWGDQDPILEEVFANRNWRPDVTLGSFLDSPEALASNYNKARHEGFPVLSSRNNGSFHDYDSRLYASPEPSEHAKRYEEDAPQTMKRLRELLLKERDAFKKNTAYGADFR